MAVRRREMSGRSRAVFLDKDGTLVVDVPYNVALDRIQLAPGVAEGLLALSEAGYRLIVVSNQSGIARGYFDEAALEAANERLRMVLANAGVDIDSFHLCPHHPDGSVPEFTGVCDCRKPEPGLLIRAARERGIDLARSWMVGDILDDVEAGKSAGCRTILVDNGNETEWRRGPNRDPDHVVRDLAEAARVILDRESVFEVAL